MNKKRLIFSKTGTAAYISHLDLMRTFQRAFVRAGIDLWHTEGFNPRAYVTIALPMPVAHESVCEILNFALNDGADERDIISRLNACLPAGIVVMEEYEGGLPIGKIKYVENEITLEYDAGTPECIAERLDEVFSLPELVVLKKGKKRRMTDTDIKPLIRELTFTPGENTVGIRAVLEGMTPYLNPVYVTAAIEKYAPDIAPNFASYLRRSILDENMEKFR
mgnify:FL=1